METNNIYRFISGSESVKEHFCRAPAPCVAVLGSYNSGKSTLINQLLGLDASPVGIVPTTSCLMYFEYGTSFRATYKGFAEKKVFHQPDQLRSFLAQSGVPAGNVMIELPSRLLNKCRLVDTPGIDSLNSIPYAQAEHAAKGADKIIYLFHQRGIDDLCRVFLYKLASLWKKRNLSDISFWLNCNLGLSDGTSLEATRSALREIFLSPVRVNTINTNNQQNIETLRLFLEVELAGEDLRRTYRALGDMDVKIPEALEKTAEIKNDTVFLSEFWEVLKTSRKILGVEQLIHSIPTVKNELAYCLKKINKANIAADARGAGGKPYHMKNTGIRENRQALLKLIHLLLDEKHIKNLVDPTRLKELYRQVAEERFTVVATGGFSTGKSTFFNALLKEEILPTADGPTTTSITRLTHATRKKAVIYTPPQVTLQIYSRVGNKACLNKEELAALERWLASADPGVTAFEVCDNNRFTRAGKPEITGHIRRVRELFAAGAFAMVPGAKTLPSTYRLIPEKFLKSKKVIQKVRVTLEDPGIQEYDLEKMDGVESFRKATGPDSNFKIDMVEIQFPAGILELATLVDTPGIDWIKKSHYEKARRFIMESDAILIFFNARHILNEMDMENFEQFLQSGMARGFKEHERLYFVVNFADTLTPLQRETVYNFIRKALTTTSSPDGTWKITAPKIFLISATKGLSGEEAGMSALLKSLEEGIIRYRGKDFYQSKIDELYAALNGATRKINNKLLSGELSFEAIKELRETHKNLRASKRRLKDIRNAIYLSGRF